MGLRRREAKSRGGDDKPSGTVTLIVLWRNHSTIERAVLPHFFGAKKGDDIFCAPSLPATTVRTIYLKSFLSRSYVLQYLTIARESRFRPWLKHLQRRMLLVTKNSP
jgi:hypothetical protein